MDVRDLTLKAAKHENSAVTALARVSAQASALTNKIHAGSCVGVTLTAVSQQLEEAVVHLSKAQAVWGIWEDEKAQPETDPSHRGN